MFWLDLKPVPQLSKLLSRNVESIPSCLCKSTYFDHHIYIYKKLYKEYLSKNRLTYVSSNSSVPLFDFIQHFQMKQLSE